MTEIDLTDSRAEDVQPQGFVPSHLAEPMLRDRDSRSTALEYVAETLGEIRLAADLIAEPGNGKRVESRGLAETISTEAGRLQRLVKALATGALLLALVTVAVVAGPSSGRAEAATVAPASAAMEAPQPDPAAQTVRVVLGAAPVTVYVRATVYTATAPGWFCASVYTARGRIGGTCSIASSFPIPVTIDPRAFPVGRTFAQVVDDATDVAVSNVTIDARRPSKFGVGTFIDLGRGDLEVRVPVTLYSPAAGRWVPQVASPVQIQELTRRGWRVRATLWTCRPEPVGVHADTCGVGPGVAVGVVHLGGGRHIIRAVRPDGATVFGTTGRNRLVVVTTEPLDVD